jgi:hypothetical protein
MPSAHNGDADIPASRRCAKLMILSGKPLSATLNALEDVITSGAAEFADLCTPPSFPALGAACPSLPSPVPQGPLFSGGSSVRSTGTASSPRIRACVLQQLAIGLPLLRHQHVEQTAHFTLLTFKLGQPIITIGFAVEVLPVAPRSDTFCAGKTSPLSRTNQHAGAGIVQFDRQLRMLVRSSRPRTLSIEFRARHRTSEHHLAQRFGLSATTT